MNRQLYALQILFLSPSFFSFAADRPTMPSNNLPQQKNISLRIFTEETWGLSETAKRLYAQAMSYDDEEKRIDPSSPIRQKIVFESAIDNGLSDIVLRLMKACPHLREKHSIGRALWSISNTEEKVSFIDLDKREFRIISPRMVFFVAQELAIKAKNVSFLESYILTLHTDPEIRKIAFPDHYNAEYFNALLYRYAQEIVKRGIEINIDTLLSGACDTDQ